MRGMEDGAAIAGASIRLPHQRTASPSELTVSRAPTRTGRSRHAAVDVHGGMAVGLVVVTAAGRLDLSSVLGVVAWAVLTSMRPPPVAGPALRQVIPLLRAGATVLAAGALLTAAAALDLGQTGLVLAVVTASVAAGVLRIVAVHRAGPVRTFLVGDLMAVLQWSSRWRSQRAVTVVGALVVQPDADTASIPHDLLGVPVSTSLDEIAARVELLDVDLVAFAQSPGVTDDVVRRAGWQLEDSRAGTAMLGLFDGVAPGRISPGMVGGATLCELEAPRRPTLVVGIKHTLDRVVAALALVLVAPLLAALAVAIRLDSRGPVIFKQTRIGLRGAPFTVYKLRTMVTGAEEVKHRLADSNEFDGVLFKMREDPRVTRLGRFLRTSSLDEVPQLVNVLKGEMSLVGPRPFLPSETAEMSRDDLRRLAVRPGITGLWQVSGRSDLDWAESAALDTYYADNWTLAGDAQIAARTVSAVLGAKGAY